ncbi:MAG TPA: TonB-dependent receptor [Gemmatimonadales bacterium]|nr:TonB-dependent receptor [Gemmatimonadales bacterium]
MRRALLAFALAALLPGALAAQGTGVINGTVRDSAGRPVADARVEATGAGRALAAVADDAGRFRLAPVPAGRVVLRIARVGFLAGADTVDVPAADSISVTVTLVPSALSTTPVIVTAAKRPQLIDQAITGVDYVPPGDIARRAVLTVDEAVDKAPAVQMLDGQVNIRGSSGFVEGLGSRVLLLVDGVPANEGDRGGINWDLVPVEDVDHVEVVKGAGSALYGSAALGGVVNVITKPIPDGMHGRFRATFGRLADPPFDLWRFRDFTGYREGLDGAGSYGAGAVAAGLSLGGWHSDGYRQQDRQNHWQTAGKARWQAGQNTRLDFSGAWVSDQYQVPLAWCVRASPPECDDRGQVYQPFMIAQSDTGAFTRSDKGYFTAVLERTPSAALTWQARSSWFRTHFTDYQPGNNDFSVADRFGAELRAVVRPDSDRVVTVGAEASASDVTSDIFKNHTEQAYSAYGESERHLGGARFTAGIRADLISVDGAGLSAVLSPRAGVVVPAGHVTWRFSAGRGFRAPSLAERFASTVIGPYTVISNPGLQPETDWSGEAGAAADPVRFLHLDAALFLNEVRDLIEPVVNDSLQIQLQNVAHARLAGLDLSATAHPWSDRLATTLAYTYLYTREFAHDTAPDQPLAFRPRHLLTLTADYGWEQFSVGADFRFSSREERVEIYETDPRVSAKVLDLRAGYERGPVAVRVQASNVLNYIYNLVPRTLAPVRALTATVTWSY